ncbi:MAG: LCP family protein [Hominilimicola sp.]|uniref:LCP family protein n=1 Tax=Hominilimicola sp. TaxID=3073571 RepID=UPI00399A19B8
MKVKFNVKRYFQVLGISLAVIIAVAAVCMGIDFSGSNNEEAVDNTSTVEAADGKINVLLMGVDVDGLRTDAIMLASFDTETKEVNMLSIPRDTKMYIGNRYQKINAAHAFVDESGEIGGATATCEAVTRITGIPINYYVDFSFDAVAHVIDELGPIEFTIPDLYGDGVGMVYDDPVQSLHINLPPGDYQLNGQQAVWLMRYRHGNVNPSTGVFKGYVNGDSDRVEMQQKFLKAVVDQKVNASLILKIPSIFKDISSEIKTNFTVSEVIKYSKYLADFSSVNIHSYSLPGEYSSDSANGDVWIPNMDEIRTMVQDVFGYPADNITTDNPKNATRESGSSSSSGISSSSSNTSNSSSSSNSKSRSSNSSYSSSETSGSSSSSTSNSSSSSSSGSSKSSSGSSSNYETTEESTGTSSSSHESTGERYESSEESSGESSSSEYSSGESNDGSDE